MSRWLPNTESWLGSFVIFQGIRTTIAKEPYFCDFPGGGGGSGPPVDPSLDPSMFTFLKQATHQDMYASNLTEKKQERF